MVYCNKMGEQCSRGLVQKLSKSCANILEVTHSCLCAGMFPDVLQLGSSGDCTTAKC